MSFSASGDRATGPRIHWIPIRGESMWPALRSGDEAGFGDEIASLREGRVVVARLPTTLIVHRVVSAAAGGVTLKGDNCRAVDPPVAVDAILGVVSHVRRGGRILPASEWDCGPRRLGAWRLWLRCRAAWVMRMLGRAR